MSTNASEIVAAQREVEAAEARLQATRDKAAGITRMARSAWDAMNDSQKAVLIPRLRNRTLILEDEDDDI